MFQDALRILVIEDNLPDAVLLRRHLNEVPGLEFIFIHRLDAEGGLEVVARERIDCIFLDYRLGCVTGLEVTRTIRSAGDQTPIIIMTAQGDEEIAANAIKAGAQDYITKSRLSPDMLKRAMDHSIEKVSYEKKLARKQEDIRHFAHTAANDLKAPLRSLRSYTQFLQNDHAGELSTEAGFQIRRIVENVDRMESMIDNLLEYSETGEDNQGGDARTDRTGQPRHHPLRGNPPATNILPD